LLATTRCGCVRDPTEQYAARSTMRLNILIALAATFALGACNKKEPTPLEKPYAIPAIETFDQLVGDQVVRVAVRGYAEHIKDARAWWRNDHDARYPNIYARGAVFEAHLGPNWYKRMSEAAGGPDFCHGCSGTFYVSKIEAWRQKALDMAREYLRDPVRLRATYARHKQTVLDELHTAGVSQDAKAYLGEALPYFTEEIPDDLWDAEDVYRAASLREIEARMDMDTCTETCADKSFTACESGRCAVQWNHWSGTVDAKNDAEHTLWTITDDWYAFEFMLRRNAEGGDAIVAAWGEILTDLEASLQ